MPQTNCHRCGWPPASGGAAEVKVFLFAVVLCRPKLIYAQFVERDAWAHPAAGHVAAFAYFSGVPSDIHHDRAMAFPAVRRVRRRPTQPFWTAARSPSR